MHPQVQELLFKLLPLLLIAAYGVWKLRNRLNSRDKNHRLPAIADSLGRPLPDRIISQKRIGNELLEIQQHEGSSAIPAFQIVTALNNYDGDFQLYQATPKTKLAELLKNRNIAQVLSNDSQFDSQFDVISFKSPHFAKSCIQDPEFRRLVIRLFELNCFTLRCDGKGIDAVQLRPIINNLSPSLTHRPTLVELQSSLEEVSELVHSLSMISMTKQHKRWLGVLSEKQSLLTSLVLPTLASIGIIFAFVSLAVSGVQHVGKSSLVNITLTAAVTQYSTD